MKTAEQILHGVNDRIIKKQSKWYSENEVKEIFNRIMTNTNCCCKDENCNSECCVRIRNLFKELFGDEE